MAEVRSKMYLQNLAMISYFDVKRRAVTVDVAFVEGTGSAKLPGAYGVVALYHRIERVVLIGEGKVVCAPSFTVGTFDQIAQAVCDVSTDAHVPCLHTVVKESGLSTFIIYRRGDEASWRSSRHYSTSRGS